MSYESLKLVLAENMKRIRLEKGCTQEFLAELANINRNYPGKIERCEANVTIDVIHRIAKSLNTTASVLLGGADSNKKRMDIITLFSKNIKKYRLANGWSQDDLAKRGINRSVISSVENGQNVTLKTVEKFADKLKVEAYKLFE